MLVGGLVQSMVVAGSVLLAATAQAENWPSRLIKAVIPFGAGSAADVVPRVVFDRLAAELGQPIVVENRPGACGTIGTAAVVKADAPAIFKKPTFSEIAIYCFRRVPQGGRTRPFDLQKPLQQS